MVSYDEERDEMFFDSSDRFVSSDESDAPEAGPSTSGSGFGFEMWDKELRSVEERRRDFLRQIGLLPQFDDEETGFDVDELVPCRSVSPALNDEFDSDFCQESNPSNEVLDGFDMNVVVTETEKRQNSHTETTVKISRNWLKRLVNGTKREKGEKTEKRVKIAPKNKKFLEFTAPFIGQSFSAHKGAINTMKFSPDGRFLATGGQDGIVQIWSVTESDTFRSNFSTEQGSFCPKPKASKLGFRTKNPIHASVVLPEKIFQINESPVRVFRGHTSEVLDLAWSTSNSVLSSSMDKTVRFWELDSDECVSIFRHSNYVTCVEFNPADERYFISGSIDGKVRIWGLSEKRVVDWTDVRDVITAICYKPDGTGFIVGSIEGNCRSYRTLDECMVLETEINIGGRKKNSGNKITGIKFSKDKPERVMISSEDSKLRVFDGFDITHKYKGLSKSGSQMSASFAPGERHIVSVGDDSRVYIWNYDTSLASPPKHSKSVQSCEHFLHEGVSVAVPWSGPRRDDTSSCLAESTSCARDSDRFSLGSWFSTETTWCSKGSATWPEEKLPLWARDRPDTRAEVAARVSEAWGLVIVAAGLDGAIKTFHNYGLPIKLG